MEIWEDVYMCVGVCVGVIHVKVRGEHWVSFLRCHLPCFLRQSLTFFQNLLGQQGCLAKTPKDPLVTSLALEL